MASGRGFEGGHDAGTVDRFLRSVRQDPKVLRADRAQGVFQKPFVEFSRRLISQNRIDRGRQKGREFARVFERIEQATAPGGYTMGHTSHLFLFDTQAGFADSWPYGTPAEEILADLRQRI